MLKIRNIAEFFKLLLGLFSHRGYLRKWVPLSILIGFVAGISSIVFALLLEFFNSLFLYKLAGIILPTPAGEGGRVFKQTQNLPLLPLITALGGLISGLLVYTFAPEAEGHGTDAAINAFHYKGGNIRARVPAIKLIASAVTIGSGGSAGREGPIALTTAGLSSLIGRVFKLNVRDRRTALAAGIGAGIGSIFKAPLGGALLASEILYRQDFEVQALVPAFISSVIGYSIYGSVFGWEPIFHGPSFFFKEPATLIYYALLGAICGLIGIIYIRVFYGFKKLFSRMKIPRHVSPAIGGALLGLIGIGFPQVLGTGYGWIQQLIDSKVMFPIYLLLLLVFLKIIATSLTVGSGGSGGVFAPSLVIGGFTGAFLWAIFNMLGLPGEPEPAAFIIVSMMAFFGGVGKAPISTIIMVSEMTGTYSLLVPSMISTVIAYVITGRHTIYISQVRTRAESPAHSLDYAVPLLTQIKVKDAMATKVVTISPDVTIEEATKVMMKNNIRGLPVVKDGKLVGMVTYSDILRAKADGRHNAQVKDIMTKNLIVGLPYEDLFTIFDRMIDYGIGRLPVVESPQNMKLVGIVTRSDIGRVYELSVQNLIKAKKESIIE